MGIVAEFKAATTSLITRYQAMRQAGFTFGGKRDVYGVLGYPPVGDLTVADFLDRYERGGIAARVVEVPPHGTWAGEMYLEEDEDPEKETPFEKTWEELEKRLALRMRFRQVDVLQRLSTYAVLLLGHKDGKFSEELPRGKAEDILYVQPYLGGGGPTRANQRSQAQVMGEGDVSISEYELDTKSPRFGQPKFYQLRRSDLATDALNVPIHWSRIIHAAEGTLRDDVFGRPALARSWNYFEDMDKVVGGGSEAFWMRANAGIHLNVDKDMQLQTQAAADGKTELDRLREQAEEYQHQLTRMIRTRGVEVNQLGSDVANFQQPADVLITLIAGSEGIPKRLLVGSERGELASSQDRENFRDMISNRQDNFAAPIIVRQTADRLIKYGYLPEPKQYKVKWPQIDVLSEVEKSTGASNWASVNAANGSPVFTEEEIRSTWAGLKPLSEDQKKQLQEAADKKLADQQSLIATKAGADHEAAVKSERLKAKKAKKKAPKSALRAAQDKPRDFSSTQVLLPPFIAAKLLAYAQSIPAEDLADDGREDKPHVTVKYGLHTADGADVEEALEDARGTIELTLGKTETFEHPEYDVLYVAVDSADLEKLNAHLADSLEHTDTHDGYTPHITVAYLKPGLGEKYEGDARFEGLKTTVDSLEFSDQDSNKMAIKLAESNELTRVLADAIASGAEDVVAEIIGLGGPGSGNFGHAGRPGQVGGSTSFKSGDRVVISGKHWDKSLHGQMATVKSSGTSAEGKPTHYVKTDGGRGQFVHADELDQFDNGALKVGEPVKKGEIVKFHTPNPDEDPHATYEVVEDRDERVLIQTQDPYFKDARFVPQQAVAKTDLKRVDYGEKKVYQKNERVQVSDGPGFTKGQGTVVGFIQADEPHQEPIVEVVMDDDHRMSSSVFAIKHVKPVREDRPGLRGFGGPGSGNFGHAGRPGQVGGSGKGHATPVRSESSGGKATLYFKSKADAESFFESDAALNGLGRGAKNVAINYGRDDAPTTVTYDEPIGRPASSYTPINPNGYDTQEKFSRKIGGKRVYTPEREELHEAIIEKALRGTTPVDNPVSTILGGAPGVGKSTIVAREKIGQVNTVQVNVDDIRNDIPEYAKDPVTGKRPALTAFTHEEASDISAKLIQRAASEKRNIVLDGTGDSTVEKLGGKVAVLRSKGHRVEATYITTTLETSTARAEGRSKNPESPSFGRKVPPVDMAHMHRQVSRVFPEAIKQGLFDKATLFDNELDNNPRLVATVEGKSLTVHDQALWNSFLAKGSAK